MATGLVTIYTKGAVYTGHGHAPHPPGTALQLPEAQAEAWIKDGVASREPTQESGVRNQESETVVAAEHAESPAAH